ncbi:unnamed protein product [Coffea canephora]|uniref:Neprosin PEP catalytic domain-containing protein n=1 Tax=Coffea canephora TaxID=49390 RepID=A0A068UGF0_COFCA|nr:unnamed protein product [Coffea canephora]
MELKGFYCFMILLIVSFSDASRLSKTPVKSIKSEDGDVIDCVHISRQPAFDNPLLRNHVIQTRPKFSLEGLPANKLSNSKNLPIAQLWQLSGSCPEETIPIRRTKQVDALTASSIHRNLHSTVARHTEQIRQEGRPKLQLAAALVEGEYYGAKATINIWGPLVQQSNELTTSLLSISRGSSLSNLSSIEVGWQVNPSLYNDNRTRLFTFWWNRFKGCYDLLCSGFIQITNKIALGGALSPLSIYHGEQFDIDVFVLKDASQDVWWLQVGKETLGYWPTSLLPNLANSASTILWGGIVFDSESDGQHTTTQMGSGHPPEEGFEGASYMKNLQVVVESDNLSPLSNPVAIAQQPNCYNVTLGKSSYSGDYIFYGGPGRNPNCP